MYSVVSGKGENSVAYGTCENQKINTMKILSDVMWPDIWPELILPKANALEESFQVQTISHTPLLTSTILLYYFTSNCSHNLL